MKLRITFSLLLACAAAHIGGIAEAQTVPPVCTDSSRECLLKVTKSYLDAFATHDGSKILLAPNVLRTEGGRVNARGEHEVRDSFKTTRMVTGKRNDRFVVDEKKGEVVAIFINDIDLKEAPTGETKAGNSTYKTAVSVPPGYYTFHAAERFRIEKGLITQIEIIAHVEHAKDGPSGWPDEK